MQQNKERKAIIKGWGENVFVKLIAQKYAKVNFFSFK